MNYLTLTAEAFIDNKGKSSKILLSKYCNLKTTSNIIYNGHIDGTYYDRLNFPNIVKINTAKTYDIVGQFPDLIEVSSIDYAVKANPDIGKLKYVDKFIIYLPVFEIRKTQVFIRKFVKIIDDNTLNINGKELVINDYWQIGKLTSNNYKTFSL